MGRERQNDSYGTPGRGAGRAGRVVEGEAENLETVNARLLMPG
jgi:hypothetical protein